MFQNFLNKIKQKKLLIILVLIGALLIWLLIDPRFKNNQPNEENIDPPIFNEEISILAVDSLPENNSPSYLLKKDSQFPYQYLASTDADLPLFFFPEEISQPNLLVSNDLVFLQDRENQEGEFFLLNPKSKTKNKFQNAAIKNINQIFVSDDGVYLAFTTLDRPKFKILNLKSNQIQQTNLNSNFSKIAWLPEDILFFVSNQDTTELAKEQIEVSDLVGNQLAIGYLNLENFNYFKFPIADFPSDFFGEPEEVFALKNGKEVFLQLNESFFRIILEKT